MPKQKYPFTSEEFFAIYSKVPRLSVDLIIRTSEGVAMTKVPAHHTTADEWYLPGGTVYFGETLVAAAERIARSELGVEVTIGEQLGYVEYVQHNAAGYNGWPVAILFEAAITGGTLSESDYGHPVVCFTEVPANIIADQRTALEKYLAERGFSPSA